MKSALPIEAANPERFDAGQQPLPPMNYQTACALILWKLARGVRVTITHDEIEELAAHFGPLGGVNIHDHREADRISFELLGINEAIAKGLPCKDPSSSPSSPPATSAPSTGH